MFNLLKTCFVFFMIVFFCSAQKTTVSLEEISNDDLKLLFTQLKGNKTESYNDKKQNFFVNIHKVFSEDYILLDFEENIYKEFYYFVASSYDLYTSRQAVLFKSENLIIPKIENVKESRDGKKFIIILSIVNPEVIALRSKEIINIESKDLKNRINTIIEIPKVIGF